MEYEFQEISFGSEHVYITIYGERTGYAVSIHTVAL